MLLPVIAATKDAAIPAMIAMIATSPRAVPTTSAVPTTTSSLRDPKTRIPPPSVALTHSGHLKVISTSAQINPEA